jgi:hypothetical protein
MLSLQRLNQQLTRPCAIASSESFVGRAVRRTNLRCGHRVISPRRSIRSRLGEADLSERFLQNRIMSTRPSAGCSRVSRAKICQLCSGREPPRVHVADQAGRQDRIASQKVRCKFDTLFF